MYINKKSLFSVYPNFEDTNFDTYKTQKEKSIDMTLVKDALSKNLKLNVKTNEIEIFVG